MSLNEFASLKNLQTLSFESCDNLEVLPGEVQFASLEALIVRSCGSPTSLPLCSLSEIEAMFIIDCEMLQLRLPENLQSSMKTWRMGFLHLENFPRLQTLPKWIEDAVETLLTLIIINVPMLVELPECLTRMNRLKMLHIADCHFLDYLPNGIQHLSALEALTIDGCPKLCHKCQPHSGECWPMISHIQHVSIGELEEEEYQDVEEPIRRDDHPRYIRTGVNWRKVNRRRWWCIG